MKRYFCAALCMLSITSGYSQVQVKKKPKSEHTLSLSYTPQWFPDKNNVRREYYDHNLGQVLYPKANQMGHNFGIAYQFVHTTGVILSLGIQTGVQNHEVRVLYNNSFLGSQYKDLIFDNTYKGSARYYTLRPMIGYRFRSPLKFAQAWDLDVKIGVAMRWYQKSEYEQYSIKVGEQTSPDTVTVTTVGFLSTTWGSKSPYGRNLNYTGEYYLGFNRNVNWSFVRSLSVGVEGSFALSDGSSGAVILDIFQTPDTHKNLSRYTYGPKDFSLGIRFAIGLGYWK